MIRTRLALLLIAAVAAVGVLFAACDSTPTVPVPPPELCQASVPVDGLCTVGCASNNTERDVALVYNENLGEGVMRETEPDGSFEVDVAAEVGDQLIVQLKQDNHLSAEVYLTVPAE